MSRPPFQLNPVGSGYANLDRDDSPSPQMYRQPYPQHSQMQPNPFYDRSQPGSPRRPRYDSSSSGGHGTAQGVMMGAIGGGYGPYSYEGSPSSLSLQSPASPDMARYTPRNSSLPSPFANFNQPPSSSGHSSSSPYRSPRNLAAAAAAAATAAAPLAGGGATRHAPIFTARDAELDDRLHNPSPSDKYVDSVSCTAFSLRGWLNVAGILVLVVGLVTLFAGYPIIQWATSRALSTYGAFNLGGINASGQVPNIPGLPSLIDSATPSSALSRTGFDGEKYVLVFSDEFNNDGRTFWPGDDPFWEAVDLHYWATGDFEWYDPDAVTTKDGNLVLTISEEPIHGLNFRSGMLQSWNKFCFTGGYIEVNISLPGSNDISGFWPGAWTLGNLARAGYGSTTDGTWPYSYNSCDLGTLPNQTNVAGTGPAAALDTGLQDYGGALSYLPGQRLSACTCAGGDHPGPNVGVGRGAPEIDILEAQVSWTGKELVGSVSQSAQFAPYDAAYDFKNQTPYTVVHTPKQTYLNEYKGGVYQQACSGVTYTDADAYQDNGGGFSTYGWESWPDTDNGFITWAVDGEQVWTLNAGAVGPNSETQVGQRLISQEPMSIILNLGMSSSFQTINWADLKLPGQMLVDYVRVYQREGSPNVGCDPEGMPTSKYINDHLAAYSNPNYTTWAEAGFEYPKNSMQGC
ncbi:hypothetical protein JCM21900_003313 [Sporobolomyces salmonicolor]